MHLPTLDGDDRLARRSLRDLSGLLFERVEQVRGWLVRVVPDLRQRYQLVREAVGRGARLGLEAHLKYGKGEIVLIKPQN